MQFLKTLKAMSDNQFARHVSYWLVLAIVFFLTFLNIEGPVFAVKLCLVLLLPQIIPVYVHLYLFENFLTKKKYFIYFACTILLIIIFGTSAEYFHSFIIGKGSTTGVLNVIFILIITTLFRYKKYYRDNLLLLKETENKKIEAELALLKSQINPHFLFNTLNNLYAMARKTNEKSLTDSIANLSNLLRHMIYDCNADNIELSKEIEQVQNFIKLQKLRFTNDDDIKINIQISGELNSKQIVPMLLFPFVENAFKHGINLDAESFINIKIIIDADKIYFEVVNSKFAKDKSIQDDGYSGIGLQNVKRRLEILYPNSFNLEVLDNKDIYSVKLILTKF